MADDRNQAKQHGNKGSNGRNNFKGNGTGNGNGNGEKRESAKERKLRLINEDNIWNVIKNKTPDTTEYINLLNSNDDLIFRLRMHNFERSTTLTYDDLKEFIQRNNAIKDAINQLNIDLSKAVGRDYRPPRGYSAQPAKQPQQPKTEKKQKEQTPQRQQQQATPLTQELPAATA